MKVLGIHVFNESEAQCKLGLECYLNTLLTSKRDTGEFV